MSEPLPDDFPLGADEVRHMLDGIASTGGSPDFTGTIIDAAAGMHARWYHAWQAAGVPEHRAAEWTAVMIRVQAASGS